MGMAASQARYLALTARKTNVEYEGQQINQARTALANQSANLFNQMSGMGVPTPPSVRDYTTVQYSFSDGYNTEVLSNYYQLGNNDSDYNYVVTTYHNEKVFTGQRKLMNDPQVQYMTKDNWSFDPTSFDDVRPKIVDKAVKNGDGTYTIETSDDATHIFRKIQAEDKATPQANAIREKIGNASGIEADRSETINLQEKNIRIDSSIVSDSFVAIDANDTEKIEMLKTLFGAEYTDNLSDFVYSPDVDNGQPAFAREIDKRIFDLGLGTFFNAKGVSDRTKFSLVDKNDTDTVNLIAKLYDLNDTDVERVKNGDLRFYTDGEQGFVIGGDYEGVIPQPIEKIHHFVLSPDPSIDDYRDENNEAVPWPMGYHFPAETVYISINGAPELEYKWDDGANAFLCGGVPFSQAGLGLAVGPGSPPFTMRYMQEPASTDPIINDSAVVTRAKETTTDVELYTDDRGNFLTLEELESAVSIYEENKRTGAHNPINVDMMMPKNSPEFSNYTLVGNCRLTELTSADLSDEDVAATIDQIIKDMQKVDGSPKSAENFKACFDINDKGELVYKGGIYSFKMGGQLYYTTERDLDESAGTSIVDNEIDVQQKKLAYYNAIYENTRVEDTQKALLETDGKGRFKTMKLEDDSVVYTLNVEEVTDEASYNDAMNQYYYQNAIYEQTLQEINAKTEIIQAQDRTLELRLEQLQTEQSALQNEMEAVKKVVDKHVELGFKTFGG